MESGKKSSANWGLVLVLGIIALIVYFAINMQRMEQQIKELQIQNKQLASENKDLSIENSDYVSDYVYEYKQLYKKHQDLIDSVETFLNEMEESPLYDKYKEIQDWWMILSINLSYYD